MAKKSKKKENKYFTQSDRESLNQRFMAFLDTIIGKEPYKLYPSRKVFAEEVLGVNRALIYNIGRGKNNVTVEMIATMQNLFGSSFDSRYIISGERHITGGKYGVPKNFVVVEKRKLEKLAGLGDLIKVKTNEVMTEAAQRDRLVKSEENT